MRKLFNSTKNPYGSREESRVFNSALFSSVFVCFVLFFHPQPKAMEKDRKIFLTKETQTACCSSWLGETGRDLEAFFSTVRLKVPLFKESVLPKLIRINLPSLAIGFIK